MRKFNLTLESLKHNDFEYKRNQSKLLDTLRTEIEHVKSTTLSDTKQKKLPSINFRRKSSFNNRRNSLRQSSSLNQLVEEEIDSKTVVSKSTTLKKLRKIDYSIDKFTFKKSLEVLDTPWSLNQVTSKNFSNDTLFENTDSLISKLKDLFVNKYSGKDCQMFLSVPKKSEPTKQSNIFLKEYDSLPPSREFTSKIRKTSL